MDSDKSAVLPQAFLDRMREMLQNDHEAFLEAYDQPRTYGLRVNTAKISCEEFERIVPFEVKKIPWISNGYFIVRTYGLPTVPFTRQGFIIFRSQCHDTCFPDSIQPGEYVLDMCAAPGGKATAVGSALRGKGLLVANDISTTRQGPFFGIWSFLGFPIFLWQMKSLRRW